MATSPHTDNRASGAAKPQPSPQKLAVSPSEQPIVGSGVYGLRFVRSKSDIEAACRLRFLVFNLELGEGLESAYANGYDADEFDEVCDHLVVEHQPSGSVIGTYRLQTGDTALRNNGYYSEREFDFSPYERLRHSIVELGRAAIHREHRSFDVLNLLWKGIALYAKEKNARFLLGCSSLTSQEPQSGWSLYHSLQEFLIEPELRTFPKPEFKCVSPESVFAGLVVKAPRLLRAYLSIGAKICGPPALDREFKTIDFLTMLDLENLSRAARSRFF